MEAQPLSHSLMHSLGLVQVKQGERRTSAEENVEGASFLGSRDLWTAVFNINLLSHYHIVLLSLHTTHRNEIHLLLTFYSFSVLVY